MAVRLYKNTSSASLDHGDFWCLGGIYRETYLVALPPLHVDDVTVITDLDEQYKNATLKSTVRVAGKAGAHFALTGEVYTLDGAKVAVPATSQAGEIGADGSATVALSTPVAAPKLWSAEKPNLYYVFYRLSDGNQTVERVQDRIGFRKVELKKGVFMVNGVPVKFTGTCRHEEYSPYGHALTEECWQTDCKLMKDCNINAIRTSHYNHAERFLELCDEDGFYVLDEIPSCWVANEIQQRLPHVGLRLPLQGDPRPRQEPGLRRRLELRQREQLRRQQPGRVRLREGPRPHAPGHDLPGRT